MMQFTCSQSCGSSLILWFFDFLGIEGDIEVSWSERMVRWSCRSTHFFGDQGAQMCGIPRLRNWNMSYIYIRMSASELSLSEWKIERYEGTWFRFRFHSISILSWVELSCSSCHVVWLTRSVWIFPDFCDQPTLFVAETREETHAPFSNLQERSDQMFASRPRTEVP